MTRYSVQPRDPIFVKDYEFLSLAENMGTNIGKNIRKSLSVKYSQIRLDHAKNLQQIHLKLKNSSKRVIQKTAEAIGDLIGNKIANRITRVSKNP